MAGYSQRSLADKLGIKDGHTVLIISAPENYDNTLNMGDRNVTVFHTINAKTTGCDVIQFFTRSRLEFEKKLTVLQKLIRQNGMIWISWPKKSSGVNTDLDENIIREYALSKGLVDVKVCAIDEIWSGLKLVIPLKNRTE